LLDERFVERTPEPELNLVEIGVCGDRDGRRLYRNDGT
jgi:hypothetical protein